MPVHFPGLVKYMWYRKDTDEIIIIAWSPV